MAFGGGDSQLYMLYTQQPHIAEHPTQSHPMSTRNFTAVASVDVGPAHCTAPQPAKAPASHPNCGPRMFPVSGGWALAAGQPFRCTAGCWTPLPLDTPSAGQPAAGRPAAGALDGRPLDGRPPQACTQTSQHHKVPHPLVCVAARGMAKLLGGQAAVCGGRHGICMACSCLCICMACSGLPAVEGDVTELRKTSVHAFS